MRNQVILIAGIFMLTLSMLPQQGQALPLTTQHSSIITHDNSSLYDLQRDDLINLDREELELKLNRKLTLKERSSLLLIKRKLQKNPEISNSQLKSQVKSNGLSIAALFLAIASFIPFLIYNFIWLVIFLGPFALILSGIAIVLAEDNPKKKKAKKIATWAFWISAINVLTSLTILILALVYCC